jgi:hypothetical protein
MSERIVLPTPDTTGISLSREIPVGSGVGSTIHSDTRSPVSDVNEFYDSSVTTGYRVNSASRYSFFIFTSFFIVLKIDSSSSSTSCRSFSIFCNHVIVSPTFVDLTSGSNSFSKTIVEDRFCKSSFDLYINFLVVQSIRSYEYLTSFLF